MLTAVQHPADKSLELPIGKGTRIGRNKTFRDGRVQQGVNLTMKLFLEGTDKFRGARTESGDAHGVDALSPGVLIVSSDGENFFEKHLRGEIGAVGRKFGAAITAEDTFANDGGGERRAGDAREKGGLFVFEKGDGGERRTQYHAGTQAGIFGKGFIFPDDCLLYTSPSPRD